MKPGTRNRTHNSRYVDAVPSCVRTRTQRAVCVVHVHDESPTHTHTHISTLRRSIDARRMLSHIIWSIPAATVDGSAHTYALAQCGTKTTLLHAGVHGASVFSIQHHVQCAHDAVHCGSGVQLRRHTDDDEHEHNEYAPAPPTVSVPVVRRFRVSSTTHHTHAHFSESRDGAAPPLSKTETQKVCELRQVCVWSSRALIRIRQVRRPSPSRRIASRACESRQTACPQFHNTLCVV